jgi:hypothetical protein
MAESISWSESIAGGSIFIRVSNFNLLSSSFRSVSRPGRNGSSSISISGSIGSETYFARILIMSASSKNISFSRDNSLNSSSIFLDLLRNSWKPDKYEPQSEQILYAESEICEEF